MPNSDVERIVKLSLLQLQLDPGRVGSSATTASVDSSSYRYAVVVRATVVDEQGRAVSHRHLLGMSRPVELSAAAASNAGDKSSKATVSLGRVACAHRYSFDVVSQDPFQQGDAHEATHHAILFEVVAIPPPVLERVGSWADADKDGSPTARKKKWRSMLSSSRVLVVARAQLLVPLLLYPFPVAGENMFPSSSSSGEGALLPLQSASGESVGHLFVEVHDALFRQQASKASSVDVQPYWHSQEAPADFDDTNEMFRAADSLRSAVAGSQHASPLAASSSATSRKEGTFSSRTTGAPSGGIAASADPPPFFVIEYCNKPPTATSSAPSSSILKSKRSQPRKVPSSVAKKFIDAVKSAFENTSSSSPSSGGEDEGLASGGVTSDTNDEAHTAARRMSSSISGVKHNKVVPSSPTVLNATAAASAPAVPPCHAFGLSVSGNTHGSFDAKSPLLASSSHGSSLVPPPPAVTTTFSSVEALRSVLYNTLLRTSSAGCQHLVVVEDSWIGSPLERNVRRLAETALPPNTMVVLTTGGAAHSETRDNVVATAVREMFRATTRVDSETASGTSSTVGSAGSEPGAESATHLQPSRTAAAAGVLRYCIWLVCSDASAREAFACAAAVAPVGRSGAVSFSQSAMAVLSPPTLSLGYDDLARAVQRLHGSPIPLPRPDSLETVFVRLSAAVVPRPRSLISFPLTSWKAETFVGEGRQRETMVGRGGGPLPVCIVGHFVKCLHILCVDGMNTKYVPSSSAERSNVAEADGGANATEADVGRRYRDQDSHLHSQTHRRSSSPPANAQQRGKVKWESIKRDPVMIGLYRVPCQGHFDFALAPTVVAPSPSAAQQPHSASSPLYVPPGCGPVASSAPAGHVSLGSSTTSRSTSASNGPPSLSASVPPLRIWTTRKRSVGLTVESNAIAPSIICTSLYGAEVTAVAATPSSKHQHLMVFVDCDRPPTFRRDSNGEYPEKDFAEAQGASPILCSAVVVSVADDVRVPLVPLPTTAST